MADDVRAFIQEYEACQKVNPATATAKLFQNYNLLKLKQVMIL